MGVPASEVGYTPATARRGDHGSSYEHVVALEEKNIVITIVTQVGSQRANYNCTVF